jgi:predicted GTPase
MECAIKKNIYRRGKTFAVNLIAHDCIAEANRPRRAVFAVTVRLGKSALSANARSPTGGGMFF